MKITSNTFVKVLINSTLNKNEQKVLVKMLPNMSKEQIIDLYKILTNDVARLKKIIVDFNSDVDRLIMRTVLDLEVLKK